MPLAGRTTPYRVLKVQCECPLATHSCPSGMSEHRPLLAIDADRRNDRHGEGFRTPAISGRGSWHGPAYGNRPCTNPRAARMRLWSFEDFRAVVHTLRAQRRGAGSRLVVG